MLSQCRPAHTAISASNGDKASHVQATPRPQKVAPAATASMVRSNGKGGTPDPASQNPKTTKARALVAAAASRSAVRRPRATAIAPRPVSDERDHGVENGMSNAGSMDCVHAETAGENTTSRSVVPMPLAPPATKASQAARPTAAMAALAARGDAAPRRLVVVTSHLPPGSSSDAVPCFCCGNRLASTPTRPSSD